MMNEIKILLIDDDEDDYVHIRDLFDEISRSKYKIEWKSTYESGFSALQEQDFDACLLDYRLGAKTGLDLLQSIRKLNLRCPIIFLTGLADFDLDLKAMQVGAADYLVKGQLTSPLLERSVRYSMKQALDLEELRDIRAQVLQQDRLASLGLLASSLAHEIGTPLGVIRSRAELAQKKAGDNENLKNDMVIVVSQIDRISKLVNSLLHLARGKQSDFAVEVSIGEVIQDVLNLLQH
jgi:DNA-binding NtrC family response regulator